MDGGNACIGFGAGLRVGPRSHVHARADTQVRRYA